MAQTADVVIYEKEGEIARITLNRPEKLNAISQELMQKLREALYKAQEDDELKVVIIKGAGRSFCSGFDLNDPYVVYQKAEGLTGKERPSQRVRLKLDRNFTFLNQEILLFPIVTIAQVQGHCIGEGSTIAEQCDITIVADDAQISHAEQRLGFAGSGENLVPLFAMIGYKKARFMVLTGDALSGVEAEGIGWATKSVPADKLEEEVNEVARKICLLPRDGIAIGKASNHLILDMLGYTHGWVHGYVTHTLFTNLKYAPGEFVWAKDRSERGTKVSFHTRDDRYSDTA